MDYKLIIEQLKALADSERGYIPLFSNASALLYESLDNINWVGFYLMDKGSLLLGPFQGKVACIRIPLGKGVCGTAAKKDEVLVVENVHEFPGHIACDSASNSEIVIPIHRDGRVIGVLDIDSPEPGRFTKEDDAGLKEFALVLEEVADFSSNYGFGDFGSEDWGWNGNNF